MLIETFRMADKNTTSGMDFVISLSHKDYKLSITPWSDNMETPENNQEKHAENQTEQVPYDVNLVVGDTTIPAHKSVLTEASEYFRAMFSGDFAEANRNEIELPAVSAQGLKIIVDALYSSSLSMTSSNVLEILTTADQLEVQDVIDCCEDFLILGIDTTNCFELLQLSEKYTLPRLNQEIEQFVLRNFPQVCDHSLFPFISQDALITLISNDELDYKEIDIFKGVMKWFKIDPSTDKSNSIDEIMKHIRFTYMESKEILNEVLSLSIILENEECKEAIEDALRYVILYEKNVHSRPMLEESNKERPRGRMCVVAVPPKFAEGEESRMLNVPTIKQLLFFGFSEGSLDMSDMTVCESLVDFAVFSMNILQKGDSVFFLGAHPLDEDGKDAQMTLLRFNVQSGEWVTLKSPDFSPIVVSVSIIHGDNLYFIGGAAFSNKKTIPQNTFKKDCYRYSIPKNSWSQIADYPHPVSHPAACAIGEDIFVVGGGGSNYNTWYRDRVFAYNTLEDTWTEKCHLNNGRAGHRICTINGKIFVMGGRDPHREDVLECEVYDPSADQWTVLDSAPIPRSVASYAMVLHKDNITLVGGRCDKEVRHPIVQTFNTDELTWTSYNWKKYHPDLLLSGSIHRLPLLRVRLSSCRRYNDIQDEINTCGDKLAELCTKEYQVSAQPSEHKSYNNPKQCSTQ